MRWERIDIIEILTMNDILKINILSISLGLKQQLRLFTQFTLSLNEEQNLNYMNYLF